MPFESDAGCQIGHVRVPYWTGGVPFNTCGLAMPSAHLTERRIELPLAYAFLQRYNNPGHTVELGGVTPYYFDSPHTVIDIEDPHPQCVHVDIRNIRSYVDKLVLTVSTLEHIQTVEDALGVVIRICSQASHYLITFPLGFNVPFDQGILERTDAGRRILLVRQNDANDWAKVPFELTHAYGKPFKYANAVCVLSDQPVEQLFNL